MSALIVLAALMSTLAALVAITRSYRIPAEMAGFKCKTRWAPVEYATQIRWPLSVCRAAWCHDVLIVRQGMVKVEIKPLAVRSPAEPLRELRRSEVHGLGREVVCLVLRLDDGSLVEVAAPARNRTQLVGPFLAVAIAGLPPGPRERRTLGH